MNNEHRNMMVSAKYANTLRYKNEYRNLSNTIIPWHVGKTCYIVAEIASSSKDYGVNRTFFAKFVSTSFFNFSLDADHLL